MYSAIEKYANRDYHLCLGGDSLHWKTKHCVRWVSFFYFGCAFRTETTVPFPVLKSSSHFSSSLVPLYGSITKYTKRKKKQNKASQVYIRWCIWKPAKVDLWNLAWLTICLINGSFRLCLTDSLYNLWLLNMPIIPYALTAPKRRTAIILTSSPSGTVWKWFHLTLTARAK